jgi:hypothetical protein
VKRALYFLASALVACSAPPEKKRDAGAAVAARDAGAPVVEVPPSPPPTDTGSAPSETDSKGPVRVHLRMLEPQRLFSRDYLFEGAADGGTWTRLERRSAGRGVAVKYARSMLDAEQTADLLGSLDATEWWGLSDVANPGAGGTRFLDIRRGGTRHRFEVRGACWCDNRCLCPQAKALDAANIFFHRAKVVGLEVQKPTAFRALSAPAFEQEDGGTAPPAEDCELSPMRELSCGKTKCVRQGKVAACFESPFLEGDAGVRHVTIRKELKTRGDRWALPWAFRTATGRTCLQKAWPSPREQYTCEPNTPAFARLFWAGKTLVAETKEPDWSLETVVEAWR